MNFSPFIYAFERENIALRARGPSTATPTASTGGRGKGGPNAAGPQASPVRRKTGTSSLDMAEKAFRSCERVFGEGHYCGPSLFSHIAARMY